MSDCEHEFLGFCGHRHTPSDEERQAQRDTWKKAIADQRKAQRASRAKPASPQPRPGMNRRSP